ncbi:hypothetical protein HXX76_014297 [Chlamydomonas incerta]|uniref:Uncharacterized protein n=1 Tax=Chlamydomonas incerta TaxID=51695 RepID=A0A835VTH5_CHLIN|nr:hypothetical protein HXX76_014297 [Chlamydomonas incerta]|eukprot:KAG2424721.1 hypothetical protein HXX76_014297 [Chlamydomonas incerta]
MHVQPEPSLAELRAEIDRLRAAAAAVRVICTDDVRTGAWRVIQAAMSGLRANQLPPEQQTLLEWLHKERLIEEPPARPFRPLVQNSWNLVNDSLRTTLCLQFPPPKIVGGSGAVAAGLDEHGRCRAAPQPQVRRAAASSPGPQPLRADHARRADPMLSEYESSEPRQLAVAQGAGRAVAAGQDPGGRMGAGPGGSRAAAAAEGGAVSRMEVQEEDEVKD